MKRHDLTKLALMGLVGGCLLASNQASADEERKDRENEGIYLAAKCGAGCNGSPRPNNPSYASYRSSDPYVADNDSDMVQQGAQANFQQKMTKQELENKLDPQTKALYQNLSDEGRGLALKLANQDCKGKNDCKGMSACKSDKHECAGKNSCKGQGTCKFQNSNLAVKVAAKKMAEKRSSMNQGGNGY